MAPATATTDVGHTTQRGAPAAAETRSPELGSPRAGRAMLTCRCSQGEKTEESTGGNDGSWYRSWRPACPQNPTPQRIGETQPNYARGANPTIPCATRPHRAPCTAAGTTGEDAGGNPVRQVGVDHEHNPILETLNTTQTGGHASIKGGEHGANGAGAARPHAEGIQEQPHPTHQVDVLCGFRIPEFQNPAC